MTKNIKVSINGINTIDDILNTNQELDYCIAKESYNYEMFKKIMHDSQLHALSFKLYIIGVLIDNKSTRIDALKKIDELNEGIKTSLKQFKKLVDENRNKKD